MAWLILQVGLSKSNPNPTEAVKALKRETAPWLQREQGLRAATLLVNSENPQQQGELWLRFHGLAQFEESELGRQLQSGDLPFKSVELVDDKPKLLVSPEVSEIGPESR